MHLLSFSNGQRKDQCLPKNVCWIVSTKTKLDFKFERFQLFWIHFISFNQTTTVLFVKAVCKRRDWQLFSNSDKRLETRIHNLISNASHMQMLEVPFSLKFSSTRDSCINCQYFCVIRQKPLWIKGYYCLCKYRETTEAETVYVVIWTVTVALVSAPTSRKRKNWLRRHAVNCHWVPYSRSSQRASFLYFLVKTKSRSSRGKFFPTFGNF